MSKTADLDKTISLLNEQLAKPKLTLKDRMTITDRLLRAYALKLKYDETGKGGKFAAVPAPKPAEPGDPPYRDHQVTSNGATNDVGNNAAN